MQEGGKITEGDLGEKGFTPPLETDKTHFMCPGRNAIYHPMQNIKVSCFHAAMTKASIAAMHRVQPVDAPNLLADEYGFPLYVPPMWTVPLAPANPAALDGTLPVATPPRYQDPMSVSFPFCVRKGELGPTLETSDRKAPKYE